jgi:uncharacterized membrane-anchored protein
MNNKKIIFSIFILIALAQLFVPGKMIFEKERVISSGAEYKFKTVPIDPNDPFRGKYITLSYDETRFMDTESRDWLYGDDIYVILTTDKEGFAKIESVSRTKPSSELDFVKATVINNTFNNEYKVEIEYPFNRYYMEESKALQAELIYRETMRDSKSNTYALVSVKGDEAVLKDVLIDGVSIKDIVKERQED